MVQKMPVLSIVIPSYNEATYIDRLLEDLLKQTFTNFEVIVSDAKSKDDTAKVVKGFSDKLDIKIVEAEPKGPGYGRNRGAEVARGEWLLFLDADVHIEDKNFLEILVGDAETEKWNTASAKMRANSPRWHHRFGTWFFYHYQKLLAHTKHPVAQGYCILTRRKIFEDNHGFNEKILLGEDNDYVSRVGKYGFGFTDRTYYLVDLRRNETEGLKYAYKAIANEFYRHTRGYNLESNKYAYDFGKHKPREKK